MRRTEKPAVLDSGTKSLLSPKVRLELNVKLLGGIPPARGDKLRSLAQMWSGFRASTNAHRTANIN